MDNSINAVIIEDDESSSSHLEILIKTNFNNMKISGIAQTVKDGISLINSTKPDLVFLDIDLPDGNGFDIPLKTKIKKL
jgi:two-component system LytT family response regulator